MKKCTLSFLLALTMCLSLLPMTALAAETKYLLVSEITEGMSAKHKEYTYDDNGNCVKATWLGEDGTIFFFHTYAYDDAGNMLTETEHYNDGSVLLYYEYTYDAAGNKIGSTVFGSDGTSSLTVEYTYDADGNMLTERRISRDGTPAGRFEYTYDADGKKLTMKNYNPSDENDFIFTEYTYDAYGNILSETEYEDDGTVRSIYTNEYTYDAAGNILTKAQYGREDAYDEGNDKYEYTYDANGNILTTIMYWSDGTFASRTEYTYVPWDNNNTPETPAEATAYASTQTVSIDGKPVTLQAYALKDANGNPTNYVKLRDVAYVLNGSAAQFNVGWDGNVNIITGAPYEANGSEMSTPFSGDRAYTVPTAATNIDGQAADLAAIVLTDDNGGAYTYYQLRDLGKALGFNVGWSAEQGIFIETDEPYTDEN